MLSKLLNDIFTEKDDLSYCPVRICGVFGFFSYLILAYIELLRHCHDFNLVEVASGMSVILGVLAGSVTIKSRGEDKQPIS